LIDTSAQPVDTIDKFNVSPINDNVECRRSTALELTRIFLQVAKLAPRLLKDCKKKTPVFLTKKRAAFCN
jgi:hypothetical protein